MTTLDIYVEPNAGQNKISGKRYDRLKVLVSVGPEDNKANERAIKVISEELDIPKSYISIKHGTTSREKTLSISNYSREQLDRHLKAAGFSDDDE